MFSTSPLPSNQMFEVLRKSSNAAVVDKNIALFFYYLNLVLFRHSNWRQMLYVLERIFLFKIIIFYLQLPSCMKVSFCLKTGPRQSCLNFDGNFYRLVWGPSPNQCPQPEKRMTNGCPKDKIHGMTN